MLKSVLTNEADAFAAFNKGEDGGLSFLFKVYYPTLLIFANKFTNNVLSEEIVNEAFFKIWEKRNAINSLTHFRSYLYKIIYRDCLKVKQQKNNIELNDSFVDEFDFSTELIKSETLRHIYYAIEALPEQCKQVFTQLYVEGKTVRETADELGVAVSTVKAQKARGIQLLKIKLGNTEMITLLLTLFLNK